MTQTRFIIHTNAPVNQTLDMTDDQNEFVELDAFGSYRSHFKRSRDDTVAVLEFETGHEANIEVIDVDDHQGFAFTAPQHLVQNLEPGLYVADIIRTDASNEGWEVEFPVSVIKGITPA